VDFAELQLTDSRGAVRVGGLSLGEWIVRVTLAGHRAAEQPVEVRAGEPASARLALPPLP
jgi:hypothetical protein